MRRHPIGSTFRPKRHIPPDLEVVVGDFGGTSCFKGADHFEAAR
jgi:hypothetical protein